jgi:hypothetical protein
MTLRYRAALGAVLVALTPLLGGCATAGMTPSASVTTAMQGWERWLRVEWTGQTRPGGHEIDGYVYSTYGSPIYDGPAPRAGARRGRQVVSQKMTWVSRHGAPARAHVLPGPAMGPAASYRVTVWAFETLQSQGWL